LIYSLAGDIQCESVTGRRDYCPPNSYRAQPSRLYHNRGNGKFEDVTARALVGGAYGPALGAAAADFNNDGWIDLYVANDGQPNQLWINQHDGTFKDTAFLAGVAVSGTGQAEASMGIDAGDIDNDGDEDIIITNWLDQMNVLYVNDGSGNFEDQRGPSGLGTPSLAKTGFGAGWFDFDRDGFLDLLVANGGVATIEALARANDPFPLRMTPQLYRNQGNGRFEDVSSRAGSIFKFADVGRGVAFGDIDNDGDTDVLVANDNGRLRLLVNHAPNQNHWLGLRLIGGQSPGRDMVGARVEIIRAERAGGASAERDRGIGAAGMSKDQPTLYRRARADGSYASANDPRILAGLGASTAVPRVRVRWPSGRTEEFSDVGIDRYTTIREGSVQGLGK
jgi:enediyne biosynthesis protein E4